jgi:hypothetical protein
MAVFMNPGAVIAARDRSAMICFKAALSVSSSKPSRARKLVECFAAID